MSLFATGTQLPWHDPGAAEEDRCCCGSWCCMFPAGTEWADCPAAVKWGEVVLTKDGEDENPLIVGYSGSGVSLYHEFGIDNDRWHLTTPNGEYWSLCLFQDFQGIESSHDPEVPSETITDDFLGEYHFTFDAGNGPIAYTLTRVGQCRWVVTAEGHNPNPDGVKGLYYESEYPYVKNTFAPPFNLAWVLSFVDDNGDSQAEILKDEPQDGPTGTYGSGWIAITP